MSVALQLVDHKKELNQYNLKYQNELIFYGYLSYSVMDLAQRNQKNNFLNLLIQK